MASVRVKSEPVQILHRFIKEALMDEDFTFECPDGLDHKYVHRMRVELSRLRDQVRERGRVPKAFKLAHVSSLPKAGDATRMLVVIRKSSKRNEASQFLDDALLAGMIEGV